MSGRQLIISIVHVIDRLAVLSIAILALPEGEGLPKA
jgi:hypothetical protein